VKEALKFFLRRNGGNFLSPLGVNWLVDIERISPPSASINTILDVGANVGQTCTALHRAFPDARIWAFEPIASTFAQLQANTAHLKQVTAVAKALGAEPGTAQAKIHPTLSQVNSIIRPGVKTSLETDAFETVTIDTVDRFCAAEGIETIDILKTDTEGYDLEVFRGAQGLLSSGRVRFVYTEVGFHPEDVAHTSFFSAYEALACYGFRFMGLYELHPMFHCADEQAHCNALFMRSSRSGD
jgi:FkbM family methyltransferase